MRHVKVARVALKDDRGALQTLNLATQRRRVLAGWIAQAQQFYANAASDPAILGKLAEFGITRAMLEAGAHQVDAVDTCNVVQQQRKGTAQDATRARDEAIAAMDARISDFIKIARVALKRSAQFLEKLGVTAAKQRASRPTLPTTAPAATAPIGAIPTASAESEPILVGSGRRPGSRRSIDSVRAPEWAALNGQRG